MVVIVWFEIDSAPICRIGNRTGIFDNNMADSLVTPFPATLRIFGKGGAHFNGGVHDIIGQPILIMVFDSFLRQIELILMMTPS